MDNQMQKLEPGALRNLASKRVSLLLQELRKCYATAVNTWTTSSEVTELFIFLSHSIFMSVDDFKEKEKLHY
jgi:hypothetical protein